MRIQNKWVDKKFPFDHVKVSPQIITPFHTYFVVINVFKLSNFVIINFANSLI